MTCFSVVVVASVLPFVFVQAEAGDALHQVASGCLNLNHHALHSLPQLAPRGKNNSIIFCITMLRSKQYLKAVHSYPHHNYSTIYALSSVLWLTKSLHWGNTKL
jgi:hypothetical protein